MYHLSLPTGFIEIPAHLHSSSKSGDDVYMLEYVPFQPLTELDSDVLKVTQVKQQLRYYDYGIRQIYRATMFVDSWDREVDVVLKIGFEYWCSRLKQEARIYDTLKPTRRNYTPVCWGLYTGKAGNIPFSVLVLEDCGEELKVPVYKQPLQFRKRVINALINIHRAGVVHCNLVERHVVVRFCEDDGSPWPVIVDFDVAQPHDCPVTGIVEVNCPAPLLMDPEFQCWELRHEIHEAQLWYPSEVKYYGRLVPVEHATSTLRLFNEGKHPAEVSDMDALDHANTVVLALEEWYKNRERWDALPFRLTEQREN